MNQEIEYLKGYGFLSFAKNMGKNLSNKYGQKLPDSTKKSTTDAIKIASKRAIQKTAWESGDLIGNKIADTITSISTKKSAELRSTKNYNTNDETKVGRANPKDVSKKRGTYLQKKDNKLLMN